jgi:branched-chain amino acid aminotransferase
VKCSKDVNKNWPLGHGQYRLSGNLGPLVPYVSDAKLNGFDDVLWLLDGRIKEMTVLNVFFLWKSRFGQMELVTPPDDGCIINGVQRQTILDMKDEIYREKGIVVKEQGMTIHELIEADKEERLFEMMGVSTPSMVQSIKRVVHLSNRIDIPDENNDFTEYLNKKLQ